MFLLIFESIGTSELILIGIIALVVFGPRKLPQMAKTIGKTMADFRRTTNEFKSTWEREVSFEEEENSKQKDNKLLNEPRSAERSLDLDQNLIATPEIKEIDSSRFDLKAAGENKIEEISYKDENPSRATEETKREKDEIGKRDWL